MVKRQKRREEIAGHVAYLLYPSPYPFKCGPYGSIASPDITNLRATPPAKPFAHLPRYAAL